MGVIGQRALADAMVGVPPSAWGVALPAPAAGPGSAVKVILRGPTTEM